MARKGLEETQHRSCLGCRAIKDKSNLIRFIETPDSEVMPDLEGKLPGRGAYTCYNKHCLQTAINQRQFKRSLKHEVLVITAEQMTDHISCQLHHRIIRIIGIANKAGVIYSGNTLINESLHTKKKPGLIIISSDISPSIGDKLIHTVVKHGVPYRSAMSKNEFGHILGKAPRSAIAVMSGNFVTQLIKAIDRYKNFLGEV